MVRVATNRWVVKLDKILVNGNVAFEDQYAMIDTGTAYIVASAPSSDKIQSYIPGAAPISSKKNLMFSFPQPSLKSVEFVFGGRSIKLQPQDFGLGAIKDKQGRMCSSIVRLGDAAWPFQDNMWIIVCSLTPLQGPGHELGDCADLKNPRAASSLTMLSLSSITRHERWASRIYQKMIYRRLN